MFELSVSWTVPIPLVYIYNYPESEGNKNTGSSSLNDELGVIELEVVVKDH